MSGKSKKSSETLRRPFDKKIWAQAQTIADRYQIVVSCQDGYWYGHGLELPLAMGGGATAQDCISDTRLALASSVAVSIERGETPPTPAAEGKRTEQVNVKLTAEEKAMLVATSQAKGFRGISDYIRATALASR